MTNPKFEKGVSFDDALNHLKAEYLDKQGEMKAHLPPPDVESGVTIDSRSLDKGDVEVLQ